MLLAFDLKERRQFLIICTKKKRVFSRYTSRRTLYVYFLAETVDMMSNSNAVSVLHKMQLFRVYIFVL